MKIVLHSWKFQRKVVLFICLCWIYWAKEKNWWKIQSTESAASFIIIQKKKTITFKNCMQWNNNAQCHFIQNYHRSKSFIPNIIVLLVYTLTMNSLNSTLLTGCPPRFCFHFENVHKNVFSTQFGVWML